MNVDNHVVSRKIYFIAIIAATLCAGIIAMLIWVRMNNQVSSVDYVRHYPWGTPMTDFSARIDDNKDNEISDRVHYIFTKKDDKLCRVVFSMDSFDDVSASIRSHEDKYNGIQDRMRKQLGEPEVRNYTTKKSKALSSEWRRGDLLIIHRAILFMSPDERKESFHTIEYQSAALKGLEY